MKLTCISTAFAVATSFMMAAERRVASPDGKLALTVSDAGGLNCRVEVDGQPLLKPSRLGLEFAGGVTLGPAATIR
ncbi:MAG TPA: glycoside hydrolase family 97 N-terminal domain-containing protein, partial [Candidatus Paceibacterota bacterium]|nr:glycoside hydrolase family 97 N-terminal domain-containing protein [Candidatus Paceibacterota bacterium]